jgi:SAM-dependent methyltransferase
MVQITGHKSDSGWWDGPERFEGVNRNIIGSTQQETEQNMLVAMHGGALGLNVGGPEGNSTSPHGTTMNLIGVNIDGTGNIFADAHDLPFADNSVTYVYSNHALEHMSDPYQAIREWVRVINPGGIFYCVLPDVMLFRHGNEMDPNDPFYAPSEMTAFDFREIVSDINKERPWGKYIKELLWNTRRNNMDFNYMGKVVLATTDTIANLNRSPWKSDEEIRHELEGKSGTSEGWGGWTSERDRYFLVEWLQKINQEFKEKNIVSPQIAEVGVFMGGTSMIFLSILENAHLYAIDDWSGKPYDPFPSLREAFLTRMKYFMPRTTVIDGNSRTLGSGSMPIKKESLDLLYIDGDHHYDWVKSDMDYFIPLVKPGGYILMDDFQIRNEVYWAIYEEKLLEKHRTIRYPSAEERWDGMIFEKLLVLQKKE